MICPSCGYENLPGQDECVECEASLQQEDVPHPDTPVRWRIMADPISSLDSSTVEPQVVPTGTPLVAGIRPCRRRTSATCSSWMRRGS